MPRRRMVVLLLDGVLPLDFAIPMHVFAREAPEFYDVVTCSVGGLVVAVAGGMQVVADGDTSLLRTAQIVVVPGWANAASAQVDPIALDELRRAASRGAQMVSICSGAFALAQAGLLAGLRVTTHWSLWDVLAEQFPDVTIERDAFFVDNGSVLTSGGVTAGVDLALHMLRKDLGPAVANHVARRIVTPLNREGGQGQFVEVAPEPPGDDVMAAAQQWMLHELSRPVTVEQMAGHVNLSARAFHRRFRAHTGTTPLAWLQRRRIERAKELLESTSLSVEDVGAITGFGTPANLRAQFRRATGLSPAAYRRRFWHDTPP
ncbi:Transcriptional regulator GlxA family, contains an amidase domain and an AraC-type DNA-binding HTH domain [Actinacidiphila alni]|uniref:Transcriptional regulator GlxA family, contains an amidase domain and an AraC-type DNA-binding HTH domain n=1 Tax=Actinacidiphila alni TaxID=380248 RepID=A0A1I2L9V9_9ACTN|nr:Transcriptional regulator GlxA family, contains an amidase domain and an AraC-type DNA-binding HTH domain [Actinacidiphila alni]